MIEIEVIEFYPISLENGNLTGTLRFSLCELGIHILGIYVTKRNDSWFFKMPGKKSNHHESGEEIWYPYISFEDHRKQQELISSIRQKGRVFIEKRMADKENPIIFPEKRIRELKKVENTKDETKRVDGAKTLLDVKETAKLKPSQFKQYIDLPKPAFNRGKKNG